MNGQENYIGIFCCVWLMSIRATFCLIRRWVIQTQWRDSSLYSSFIAFIWNENYWVQELDIAIDWSSESHSSFLQSCRQSLEIEFAFLQNPCWPLTHDYLCWVPVLSNFHMLYWQILLSVILSSELPRCHSVK